MNNRLIITLLFSLLSNLMVAEVNLVDVLDKGGTHIYFPLSDKPVIMCSNGEFSVIADKNTYTTNLSDVVSYKLIESTDNDNNVPTIQGQGTFEFLYGHIYVSGQLDHTQIYIYTTSGILVESIISKEEVTDIDISEYPQGQYVIKTPTITCKFNKK